MFEPGGRPVNAGLVPDEQKSEAEESEAGFSSGMHCDFMTELCKGNFEFIQNKTSTSGPVFEGINDVVPDIKGTTADNDETGSDHGESSSYSSDVPLIDPSLDPDLPADGKNDETTDYRQYGILEKAYDKRLSDTFDETVIGAYVNRSSETFPANSHCLSSENIHGYECNTGFMTPKMPKKMDIVTTVGKDDKIDTQPAYLDYIDYVEVQEISVVTPVHVIGPCWEFGSMSSVHLPNRECSNFRSRTNTIDQQSYMGSHRDVHGGSNRLLARVFSNTIGSMEFGKKDNKELSLTFLPNTESQIAEYTKQSFCNSNSKNLLIVSIGVTLMFIAMFGLTNLQSSMNSEGGLGVYSLAMSFVPFMLGSLFSPVIIKRFRPKACLIFGCLSPLFYVIVNFRPTFAFFLPASFILGLSKVVLWNAVSTYITEIGIDESNRKNKPPDNVISRYYGIFFLTLQLAFVFGNLISSLILLPSSTNDLDIAMLLNSSNVTKDIDVEYIETVNGTEVDFFGSYTNTTSLCGSGFCNSDEADGSQATVGDLNKTILLGLYSCCIVLSTVILVLFLDHLPEYSATYTSFRDAVYQAKSVLMMLFDGQFLLLLLMCMYTIISNGFIVADIIKVRTCYNTRFMLSFRTLFPCST